MTREEFMPGWSLLTTQPWGQSYDGRLDPQKAKLQFDFYYTQLKWATVEAWMELAPKFAAADSWPNVEEIKRSLHHINQRYVRALPGADQPPTPIEAKEAEAILTRILGREFKITNHFPGE